MAAAPLRLRALATPVQPHQRRHEERQLEAEAALARRLGVDEVAALDGDAIDIVAGGNRQSGGRGEGWGTSSLHDPSMMEFTLVASPVVTRYCIKETPLKTAQTRLAA